MNTESLIHQLLAIRSSVDAMLCALGEGDPAAGTACLHPIDAREVDTESGRATWRCGGCGYVNREE